MNPRTAIILGVLILVLDIGMLALCLFDTGSPQVGIVVLSTLAPLTVILVLTFAWHASRHAESLGINKRYWICAFFLFWIVSLPLYWLKHIWPNRVPA